jgi:hypothetical protein
MRELAVRRALWGLLVALVALLARPAAAHQGPPFPILVDRPAGPYLASVWTDPDIGIGTFFVLLAAPKGHRLPAGATVEVGVQPLSHRLPEAVYRAEEQEAQRTSEGATYLAKVPLDRGEMWRVRVRIAGPRGGGELAAEVEATPDGTIGPIGFLIYGFPFASMGFLWLRAALRRRRVAKPGPDMQS